MTPKELVKKLNGIDFQIKFSLDGNPNDITDDNNILFPINIHINDEKFHIMNIPFAIDDVALEDADQTYVNAMKDMLIATTKYDVIDIIIEKFTGFDIDQARIVRDEK